MRPSGLVSELDVLRAACRDSSSLAAFPGCASRELVLAFLKPGRRWAELGCGSTPGGCRFLRRRSPRLGHSPAGSPRYASRTHLWRSGLLRAREDRRSLCFGSGVDGAGAGAGRARGFEWNGLDRGRQRRAGPETRTPSPPRAPCGQRGESGGRGVCPLDVAPWERRHREQTPALRGAQVLGLDGRAV